MFPPFFGELASVCVKHLTQVSFSAVQTLFHYRTTDAGSQVLLIINFLSSFSGAYKK